jgi:hypothetical protein
MAAPPIFERSQYLLLRVPNEVFAFVPIKAKELSFPYLDKLIYFIFISFKSIK